MELPLGLANTSEKVGSISSKDASLDSSRDSAQAQLLDTISDTPIQSGKKSIIASLLAQSSRHLFGPTSAPILPLKHQVVSIEGLLSKLSYLKPEEIAQVKKAFQFSDAAHLGQYRHSGEPYITHPVAVAELCATWRLDAPSIMAALMHDVIEDTGCTKADLVEKFGNKVAELVEGLTKLDKLEFQSHAEAQAESFRKMFMAMARDVRVILVKLADRTHNMRTLDAVPMEKRRRVAAETIEIYAPIAHRLGLNIIYRDLQDLSFRYSMPMRFRVIEGAVKRARGNRKEMVEKILQASRMAFAKANLEVDLRGREKTLFSIYTKMRSKHLSFSQVLDVYAFRVTVHSIDECYRALGILHSLYKPMPGKFKDYIAIPKLNGYQSLHTTLLGPSGVPVEFQIRTTEMHAVAEAGVAAHWAYKDGSPDMSEVQNRAHQWLQSLIDIQDSSGDSQEFLEHVKIDLFPDAVYVFTPTGQIRALPRGATALDFAYSIHSDLGNTCVAVKINGLQLPLRSELKNSDIVEVITSASSQPNPGWLAFVRTGKARASIRHSLKTKHYSESLQLGERLLANALRQQGVDAALLSPEIWEKLTHWTGDKTREEACVNIALGRRSPQELAIRLKILIDDEGGAEQMRLGVADWVAPNQETSHHHQRQAILVDGREGNSIHFQTCCHPIPGDNIIGYLGKGEGLQVHTNDCTVALRMLSKDSDKWVEVEWGKDLNREFELDLAIDTRQGKGVLARVASSVTSADSNIMNVSMEDRFKEDSVTIRFTIQVYDRLHLSKVMRSLRANPDVMRVTRTRAV
ncbi:MULTISPECIES: bifunctional (p)ppGpp synthetase/guanosine-3',5'-bis(diphosphate) 3'-pyrophosphohydrolase [unclassified Polynucleobacter]|uniref:RelA/SpoT family protein n=1 Tax=unclassified Polynucleobacter TaxID=2640945 RepID=UPI001BFE7740|nr:bifunctional (p)ppGpp synthetase/guanosine-3',5'-bis(diphosphate) 3'-pyrophosphohydrolase [Polynucleobacter sp. MWH-S4W17]MBU3639331.1 bifunctional (p)ppGpp synthetase/guanosine-3',5'-bis(diphosphate) 3'-pyrophosphohydrolase [Polynucleobacter sp. AP-RePozz3-80-G7]QWD80780.1 bifunctional (p)ppGpp synthetase/guanosine-3',5'-bis(diphosphate) 3'-pyrophosphohydrolase [Polynucleobacter sp. MWH-S4W17]